MIAARATSVSPIITSTARNVSAVSTAGWAARNWNASGGKKTESARFLRVLFNGQLVQKDVVVDGPTRAALSIPEAPKNPLMIQGDHGPVALRNIHVRPLRPIVVR